MCSELTRKRQVWSTVCVQSNYKTRLNHNMPSDLTIKT